jgi:putative DNA primase/helicase
MTNYGDVLAQLQSAGLLVTSLEVTGRMVRCKVEGDREKRGWYVLHDFQTQKGEALIVGSFGIWRGSDSGTQKIQLAKFEISPDQLAAIRKRQAEDRKAAEALRKVDADKAAAQARKVWEKCSEDGLDGVDYLKRKGVGAHGLRVSPQGALLIPMCDGEGRLHGLQIIRSPKAAQVARRPSKEYWPAGLAVKGHYHLIGGSPQARGIVLVTEGYATGASLFEATGYPVAVAFSANNLQPVAEGLRKRFKAARILICADDDRLQKCGACGSPVDVQSHPTECSRCHQPHTRMNAGVSSASTAALAVKGAWVAPVFANEDMRFEVFATGGGKLTDFNDLQAVEGAAVVRAQIESKLSQLKWDTAPQRPARSGSGAGGKGGDAQLTPISSVEELLERFALVYGQGGQVFDLREHTLIALSDMRDLCLQREIHRAWMEHPDRVIVRPAEVGFDPSGNEGLRCNLWSGWPTEPVKGGCSRLQDLLWHLCGKETELYYWVLRWLAYPIQNPGAKMHTALVLHGGQGTGKNLFFETVMAVYGRYGRIVDQAAVEDKFNDWMSAKLFLIADEVVARSELFHVKNKLKSYITGEWVRINPKGMAARDERNRANFVFLSNEVRPVALEEDDRRHCVIYTPDRLDPSFYEAAAAEIKNGGAAALHHFLLTEVDCAGFDVATKPPLTQAKRDLIEVGMDSTSRFYHALQAGDVLPDVAQQPLVPCLSQDLFDLYRAWCHRTGQRPAPQPALIAQLGKKHGVAQSRERYQMDSHNKQGPHGFVLIGAEQPTATHRPSWLGDCVRAMRARISDYKGGADEGLRSVA